MVFSPWRGYQLDFVADYTLVKRKSICQGCLPLVARSPRLRILLATEVLRTRVYGLRGLGVLS